MTSWNLVHAASGKGLVPDSGQDIKPLRFDWHDDVIKWNIFLVFKTSNPWDLTDMMTSSNGTFFSLLAICEGNPPVTGRLPSQGSVTRNFDVFFDLHLNKWLSKQSRRRWFERDVAVMTKILDITLMARMKRPRICLCKRISYVKVKVSFY